MIRKITRRFRLYRLFETDIWGNFSLEFKGTTLGFYLYNLFLERFEDRRVTATNRYSYRIDIIDPIRKMKKKRGKYLQLKRLKLYYGFLGHKQMRKIDSLSRRKEGQILSHFLVYLENRLAVISYRLHFVENIFKVRKFLYNKNLQIDKNTKIGPNQHIGYFEIIQLTTRELEDFVRYNIVKLLINGFIYTRVPEYFFMNYCLMYGYIYKHPKLKHLSFPRNSLDNLKAIKGQFIKPDAGINIFRGTDFL